MVIRCVMSSCTNKRI